MRALVNKNVLRFGTKPHSLRSFSRCAPLTHSHSIEKTIQDARRQPELQSEDLKDWTKQIEIFRLNLQNSSWDCSPEIWINCRSAHFREIWEGVKSKQQCDWNQITEEKLRSLALGHSGS